MAAVQLVHLVVIAFQGRGRRDDVQRLVPQPVADLLREGLVHAIQRAEAFLEQVQLVGDLAAPPGMTGPSQPRPVPYLIPRRTSPRSSTPSARWPARCSGHLPGPDQHVQQHADDDHPAGYPEHSMPTHRG